MITEPIKTTFNRDENDENIVSITISYNGEVNEYNEGEEKFEYIKEIFDKYDKEEVNESFNIDNISDDDKIAVLFAIGRNEDAWNLIREHKDTIDFLAIFQLKYFTIDRTATDIFEYMYDSNIIDATNYKYFELISGKLNDDEFWNKEYYECESVSKFLEGVHDSFNGINPHQIGLIEIPEWLWSNITNDLAQDELIDDYIIGNKPAFEFTIDQLTWLIENHHVSEKYTFVYCDTMYIMDDTKYNTIFKLAYDSVTVYNHEDHRSIELMNYEDFEKLERALTYMKSVNLEDPAIAYTIFNAKVFFMYPYRTRELVEKVIPDYFDTHSNEKYILPSNYKYISLVRSLMTSESREFSIISTNISSSQFVIAYNINEHILSIDGTAIDVAGMNKNEYEEFENEFLSYNEEYDVDDGNPPPMLNKLKRTISSDDFEEFMSSLNYLKIKMRKSLYFY